MQKIQRKYLITGIFVLIVIVRFFHFGETVDSPHNWRQYDTKQYIEGYYQDGNDFLEPGVCWMGGHETLILEFPLPEYLIAKLYQVFGPELWVARAFFLLFFVLSAIYFYKILRLIFTDWVPEIATVLFGFAPLSVYYSRAIHIDFFALAFAFAMLYYLMLAVRDRKMNYLLVSVVLATVAFVEKAPYVFYLVFPVMVYIVHQRSFLWTLKRSVVFVVPVLVLMGWNYYSKITNELIPEWHYIPGFNKFTDMWYWYFGTWQQRTTPDHWITILGRVRDEILGLSGIVFALAGSLFYKKNGQYWWVMSWFFGTLLYVGIFFNLNIHHNYYQIPLIASLAILMAMGIQVVVNLLPKIRFKAAIAVVLPAVFIVQSLRYAETNYYQVDQEMEMIAKEIRKHSKPTDLVVVSYGGLSAQCPLILQPANRKGWSILQEYLDPFIVKLLHEEAGATRLAVVYDGYFTGEFQTFFESMENKVGIPINKQGRALYMCDIRVNAPADK